MTSTAATTTYPFTFTTYSNPTPVPFTKPTAFPSIFSFGSAIGCANPTASALPSNHPLDRPNGIQGACVISNAAEVNNHAFWDLYECCKGKDMTAFGSPGTCTAQCRAEDGQTWQELGECLSKRVNIVICKPENAEIGKNETHSTQSSASGSSSGKATSSGQASSSGSAQVSGSSGAASTLGAAHATFSKAGVVMFGILAVSSAAGMFL
ncbi:uncharacterized protein K460DRAFT_296971 [Cucurbitaria berberidis CBS 394.84]|uniref:Uncharacterized protein n=1 Tax=Cucurbitaria berberidis CBS 394.84 TaxID=1168544 RepID=A0A9P4L3K1_9PLEO|nr:uncharacterized protein K460DRAFT_296971 [Cucurbitaria berberidis CBS 394.84]KAF1840409.1 hypothetical protein K460DRAFT_296971 [Cucurbitaria berberidis CBS 394.84]